MHVIRDSKVAVRFESREGRVLVTLTDLATGETWGPKRAFTMDIWSHALQRVEEPIHADERMEADGDTVSVTQTARSLYHSASATVRFTLENSELVATVPFERIEEPCRQLCLLFGVNLLPGLLSCGPDAADHLVLPYRNGAVCYPAQHRGGSDRFLIYGQQGRWEIMPMLPCAGAVRAASRSALLAIADEGDCDAECRVAVGSDGIGAAGLSMRCRYTPIDPVDPIDRVVRFAALSGKDAGYAGMGRRLHRFVIEKAGRGTLKSRAAANRDIAYAGNSFVLKIMHAAKDIGSTSGDGALRVLTTFRQAMKQLALIREAGIRQVYVQLTGWNAEGHDGRWPERFPVESALGGEAGLRELIAFGQSLGFQMQVHDNYIDWMQRAAGFDPDMCVGSIYGGPLKRGCWSGGINHAGWPLAYPDEILGCQMRRVKDLGAAGVYYVDAIGMPLEISYNPAHGERRYRRACADGIRRIIRTGRETFGSVGIESGYLYGALEADYIGATFLDLKPSRATEMVDMEAPLWFMACKGHAFTMLNDTYGSVVDFPNTKSLPMRMLTMAELGLLPRNEIVGLPHKWGYPLEPVIAAMKLEYDLMVCRLEGVAMASLTDHEVLEGYSGDEGRVTRSRFSNGIEVIADYARQTLEIDGAGYPLPVGYARRKPLPDTFAESDSARSSVKPG